jgi:hypothetical protein
MPKKNYGLRYKKYLELTAYRFGADNGIIKEVLREDADWSSNRPTPESQAYVYYDDWGCVLHSDMTSLASVMDRKIELGMISSSNIKWLTDNEYFDSNGLINFNDRFAIYNGKVKCGKGTWTEVAADSIKETGLTPQRKWDYDKDDFTSCPLFIVEPPQYMYDLGKEFLKRFKINYDFIDGNDREGKNEAKKYSPLQVLVVAWYKNSQGLYYNPNNHFNHAVTDFKKVELGANNKIWDSYSDYDNSPFEKELTPNYEFGGQATVWYINQLTNEIMSNAKKLKDENSSTAGFFLPALTEDAYKSLAKNFGLEVVLKPDGSIDWANEKLDGTYKLS